MFLWESIAFGPIHSRRLGSSLGINISPTDVKICSFDCIYCECGWTLEKNIASTHFLPAPTILEAIRMKLQKCHEEHVHVNSITFSGNGEPTLHPEFDTIIAGLKKIRDQYYPRAIITCLSNSTQLQKESVREALMSIENPMLKLDAGLEPLYQMINRPLIPITLAETVHELKKFNGQCVIQSMFLKGEVGGTFFDNTTNENITAWLQIIKDIHPLRVVLYSLDRETPAQKLIKIYKKDLEIIADKVRALGIEAAVYE